MNLQENFIILVMFHTSKILMVHQQVYIHNCTTALIIVRDGERNGWRMGFTGW